MTNEEMLKVLRDLKYQFDDRIAESEYCKEEDILEALESNKMASEALDMAIKMSIKTLEQSSVDVVSRQAVLDTLDKMDKALDVDRTVENYKELLTECYKDLPPVIQKEKTGHWIKIKNSRGTTIALRCSCCENSPKRGISSDYCPNCGARMTE